MHYQTVVARGKTAGLGVGEVNPIVRSGNAGLLDGRPSLEIRRGLHLIPMARLHGEVQLRRAAARRAPAHAQNSGGNEAGFTGKRAFASARAVKRGGGKIISHASAQIGNGDARDQTDGDVVGVTPAGRAIINFVARRIRIGTRIPTQGDTRGGGAIPTGKQGN